MPAQAAAPPCRRTPLLSVEGLTKRFPLPGRRAGELRAVDDVSFEVLKGETLGIVGESGSGKSTTSRLITCLLERSAGEVRFDGRRVGAELPEKAFRREVQMVFQDSYASLNPRLTIEETIAFAPRVHGASRSAAIAAAHEMLAAVGLEPAAFGQRYPHELSGGQRQRVNIARGLVLRPKLLLLDEPVSALDKSVEAQVLNLLVDLKAQFDLTYVFISHDLNVVQYLADRTLVMYLGRVMEIGTTDLLYGSPAHPYTAALIASRPSFDPRRRRTQPPIQGDLPNPANPPSGCRFRTRCSLAEPVCSATTPPLATVGPEHAAACLAVLPGSGHSRAAPVA